MKLIVTGGAGFIGSHLCEKLLELGHEVTCIDNFNNHYEPSLKRENLSKCKEKEKFNLAEGDLLDYSRVRSLFSSDKFDIVVHLAAISGARKSIKDPASYQETNIKGTINVLEACKEFGIRKLIFASSSSVYGVNQKRPFKETMSNLKPVSPYAAAKVAGEVICHAYHHINNISVSILRYFTVYGPRQRPEMAISRFVSKAFANEPIEKYGDGSSERDYTFIDDAIDATIRAIERCDGFEVYNVGSGQSVSLNELIGQISRLTGQELIIEQKDEVIGDIPYTCSDLTKSRLKLGYIPSVKLRDGLKIYIDWVKERMRPELSQPEVKQGETSHKEG